MSEFWGKFWLTVIDKGLLALILLLAGFYLNRVLETFKGQLSREQESARSIRTAVLDLTRKLAAGSHLISWLSWPAKEFPDSITLEQFEAYEKEFKVILADTVGFHASLAALDPARHKVLSECAEELYRLDVEVARAKFMFLSADPTSKQAAFSSLSGLYDRALKFDDQLQKAAAKELRGIPTR